MSLACSDLPPLLAARPLGVLEPSEDAEIQKHLGGCPDCQKLESEILASLASAKPATLEPSAAAWAGVEARIAQDRAERGREAKPAPVPEAAADPTAAATSPPRLAPRIALGCTFCHSEVLRSEAVFCGSCLAPHHEMCFLQHGRCSAPGCTETRTVRPRDTLVRPAQPQPSILRGPLIALVLASGVAALTLVSVGLDELREQSHATQPSAPVARPDEPRPATPVERVSWLQPGSWPEDDDLSREVRAARAAIAEGRLSDAEDHLLAAGTHGFNVVREVWGNASPELEPLRRRPGFFRRAALVAPTIRRDSPRRDPFAAPPKESPK